MKVRLLAALLLTLAAPAFSSHAEDKGFEYYENHFQNPPQQYGLDCWWWWVNSNVTEEAITSDLEAMKSKGFYGAMIFDAGGHNQRGNKDVPAGPVFASKEWRKLFVHALDEAERLGLEIGFNIQSGWNLGGPCIDPEHAAKMLTFKEVKVKGNDSGIQLPAPASKHGYYKDIVVLAFPADPSRLADEPISNLDLKLGVHELGGSAPDCRFLLENAGVKPDAPKPVLVNSSDVIDITSKMDSEGNLDWTCPEGEWTVLRIGYTCTGAVVSTCSKGWNGLVLDYMSPEAFDFYINNVVEPIFKDAGHHVGKTLKFLETDSWECGGMNWSEGFDGWFKKVNGYSLLPYLPVIAGYVVDGIPTSNSFLADFRKAIADAVAQNHYKRFSEYAHSHGMGIQPESAGPHAGPLNGIDNYSYSDIMMSEFWAPSPHRPRTADRFFIKQASSAAHIYGRKIVGAESFTTIGPHWNDEIWSNQKPSFDHEICAGLNRVYFHTFSCSPASMGIPGQEYFAGTHINPRLPWWDEASAFMDYMTRIQFMVQDARFNADVLYYYGDHVPNILPFKHSDKAGTMPGFDFDACNEQILLSLKVDRKGDVTVPGGLTYKVLALPDHKVLSYDALKKVKDLLRQGATVVGPKPEKCVSLKGGSKTAQRFSKLAGKIWKSNDGNSVTRFGKGTVVTGMTAREYLLSSGVKEDFRIAEDPALKNFDYIHYTLDGRDLYFISNMDSKETDVTCSFRVAGRKPELWNTMDGTTRDLGAYSQTDGVTSIPVHFDSFGSILIVFDEAIPEDRQGADGTNFPGYSECRTLEGPWNVSFDTRWGGPASVTFDKLIDWTTSEDEGIRYYSGKALYSKSFQFNGKAGDGLRYFLTLGSVKDAGFATVRINGKDKGTVWTAPFRVDITDELVNGNNDLEVVVANSWYNRVAGDQINPEKKQYTSTNIVLSHDFLGRPTKDIKLSPSGLLGPVRVVSQQELGNVR